MQNTPIRELVVVTKNHLDIGFTETEGKVLHDACRWLLPTAAAQAKRMRETGDSFCWIVPAFIAELALEWLDGDDLRQIEAGFAAGDLAWHALPFTTHTELLDESLLDAATAVSRRLDARFGRHTICAKLTDVPSHTLALVGALARAGIECLHIGVNWMSPAPAIPRLSRWRDDAGNEVILAINPKGYGGEIRLPGEDRALLWNLIGDNMEVPSECDIRGHLAALRMEHPGAIVRSGRPEDWAGADLRARAKTLPLVTGELGDSWIFGTGSDPWKTQRFRALARLRRDWLAANRLLPQSPTMVYFDRELLLVAEHTWGGAVARGRCTTAPIGIMPTLPASATAVVGALSKPVGRNSAITSEKRLRDWWTRNSVPKRNLPAQLVSRSCRTAPAGNRLRRTPRLTWTACDCGSTPVAQWFL